MWGNTNLIIFWIIIVLVAFGLYWIFKWLAIFAVMILWIYGDNILKWFKKNMGKVD